MTDHSTPTNEQAAKVLHQMNEIYKTEYESIINLDTVKNEKQKTILQEFMNKDDRESEFLRLSAHDRFLKYRFTMPKDTMFGASFRLHYDGVTCCIGYLFSKYENNTFEHDFITFGPALTSQDGEYHSHTIQYINLTDAVNERYKDAFDIADELNSAKLDAGATHYTVRCHYPDETPLDIKQKYEQFIDDSRIAIKIHSFCWLYDYYAIEHGYNENHMNEVYKYIMHREEDKPFFERVLEVMSKVDLKSTEYADLGKNADEQFQIMQLVGISCALDQRNIPKLMLPLKVGQKFFPITVEEYNNPNDIRFEVWAEIYMTNIASNLVLNWVTPGFAFMGNWFYVHNITPESFDNPEMLNCFKYSNTSSSITRELRKLDFAEYNADQRFRALNAQLNKAISFADIKLNLSDKGITFTNEFVGRTLKDSYRLIKTGSFEAPRYTFIEYAGFMKFMFEVTHALYCANTVLGLMHSDPHANNITLRKPYYRWDPRNKWPTHYDTFAIADKIYAFQFTGEYACIIDFSRGILRDRAKIIEQFGEITSAGFFVEQDKYLYALVKHNFPAFDGDKIKTIISGDPSRAFKMFCGIDILTSYRGIKALLQVDKIIEDAAMSKQIMLIIDAGIALAEALIPQYFNSDATEATMRWLPQAIIEDCYSAFLMPGDINGKHILSFYNDQAHMKNDIFDYSRWGDTLSYDKYKEVSESIGLWAGPTNGKERRYQRFMKSMHSVEEFEAAARESSMQKEANKTKFVIEPWMND